MEKTNVKYGAYVSNSEGGAKLPVTMGCTEPIAPCLCGCHKARKVLGELPDRVVVGASGSIIKNVKSVIVPNTKI